MLYNFQLNFLFFKTTSKTCFEILVEKSFRWHLETWENQIGSIFKLNIKKKCQIPKKNWHHTTWTCTWACTWICTPWHFFSKCHLTLTPFTHVDRVELIITFWSNFNTMGEKVTLVYKEMKLLLPRGGGAGAGSSDILKKNARGWKCRFRCRFRCRFLWHGAICFFEFDTFHYYNSVHCK